METVALNIGQRIDSSYAELSRQEQRAADFILDHLGDLAVYSSTELAQHSGVSKATVSRLFRRLGFSNSQEVREHARTLRSEGVPIGAGPTALSAHLEQEKANHTKMLAGLENGRLESAVAIIAEAREVVVIGLRNSYPIALHLRQQLAQARDRVRIAPQPGQSLGEDVVALGPRDVAIVVGFRRRPASFEHIVHALGDRGVPIVLLADGQARRYTEHVTTWLECPVDSVSAFDSYSAAMSLANLLATGVLGTNTRESRERIAGITTLYSELAEVEERP